jgi:hypothetical protein
LPTLLSPRRPPHRLTPPHTTALVAYVQVLDVLEVLPWHGESQHEDNPEGAVRRWHFGADNAGLLVYLIDERDRTVHLLMLVWIG